MFDRSKKLEYCVTQNLKIWLSAKRNNEEERRGERKCERHKHDATCTFVATFNPVS
jgi:hypothetical protein